MSINERLIHTASDATSGSGNQEEGLILHLDANDVDSYDGTGSVWYDISDHEFTPSINPEEQFNTVLYTGNGSASGQSVTGVGFQPDLVWVKERGATGRHQIQDSVNGDGWLDSSDNFGYAGSQAHIDNRPVETFDSDGFTIPSNYTYNNGNNDTFVAWCFKAGGTAVSNTDGSTTSQVSVNNDLGFSIVKTSSTSGAITFGHGLDSAPEMIINKGLTSTGWSWLVYHKDIGTGKYLRLNDTSSTTTNAGSFSSVTSTTITNNSSNSSSDYINYCFASKRGVSKVGSYTGTGASGNKVYTGFEPAFVMFKNTSSTGNWIMHDNKRDTTNPRAPHLRANTSGAEDSGSNEQVDFNGDGFTLKSGGQNANYSGHTYIYLAFAKSTNETELATTTTGVWSGLQSAVSSITSDSTSTTSAPGINESSTTSSMFNQTNYWSMGDNGTSEASNEIFITLNAAKSIKGYAVYEMYQSNYRYTGTTKLYGSTDNSYWYLLGSTVQTTSVQYNRNETTFSATPEYQYYKLTMSANSRGTYQGAWELEFLVDVDVTPNLHLDAASYSGTGSTWTAEVGSDGTITGATYDEELGDSLHFDGVDDKVDCGASVVKQNDMSVEMWVNFDNVVSTHGIFSNYSTTDGNKGFSIRLTSSGHIQVDGYGTGGVANRLFREFNSGLLAGRWYHIVVIVEAGTATCYVDGESIAQVNDSNYNKHNGTVQYTAATTTRLGLSYEGSQYLDGRLGQVRIYDSILTQENIRQNYNYTKPSYPNGINGTLVGPSWNASGYFDFNGTSDHVTFNYSKWHNNFTVSFWVYFDDLSFGKLFDKTTWYASSHQAFPFSVSANNGTVTASISYGNDYNFDVNVSGSYTTGKWYHILVTAEHGDKLKIWSTAEDGTFNTTPSGEATYTGTVNGSGNNNYTIGRASTVYGGGVGQDSFFDGRISKLKMFDKVLSESEISAQFNEGA